MVTITAFPEPTTNNRKREKNLPDAFFKDKPCIVTRICTAEKSHKILVFLHISLLFLLCMHYFRLSIPIIPHTQILSSTVTHCRFRADYFVTVFTTNSGGFRICFFTAQRLAALITASLYFSGKSGGSSIASSILPMPRPDSLIKCD